MFSLINEIAIFQTLFDKKERKFDRKKKVVIENMKDRKENEFPFMCLVCLEGKKILD